MKSGFVVLAGRPNVGKSTLVNALVGHKVAIVSDKPQTTRHRISGVVAGDGYQLVLLDLPDFQRPRDALTERMQRTVDATLADADAVLLVLSASEEIGRGDRFIAERVYAGAAPVFVALNKVDQLRPAAIFQQIERAAALGPFRELHPISALHRDGLAPLVDDLVAVMPEGPAYYEPGQLTDRGPAEQVAELVREQALRLTRDELPHSVTVLTTELERPRGGGPWRINADLVVETESHKGMLIGKDGSMLKAIGTNARLEAQRVLGGNVYLELRVRVRRGWRRDATQLDRLGY